MLRRLLFVGAMATGAVADIAAHAKSAVPLDIRLSDELQ